MSEKQDDEMFLVSSDTESEFGDENNLFYDEESNTKKEIKYSLRTFDRDNGGLSNIYQEKFVPKLKDKTHNFMKWLIDTDLLSSTVVCPNSKNDSKCSEYMEFVLAVGLHDLYQLRCKNCSRKESVRKSSIFYGLKCNLRTVIRVLYGWVKGVDVDLMANMLGLNRHIIGKIYNRAAKVALCYMGRCPGLGEFGGENIVVLVDIYPDMLDTTHSLKKPCRPILCISEVESMPQKYWLEPLDYWDKSNPMEVKKMRDRVVDLILTLIKPGSILVLPKKSTLSFCDCIDTLFESYPTIRYLDVLIELYAEERPLSVILDTIWKIPIARCEQAQFFNPNYVSQFLVRHLWNEMTSSDSFIMLIGFIVYETRIKNIETYFEDNVEKYFEENYKEL